MAEQDFSRPAAATHSLGLAGRMARLFIASPVTPMILVVALLVGLIGLGFTPRQEDPQISVPMIDVFVQYPGTSSGQVASLVTEPLDKHINHRHGNLRVFLARGEHQANQANQQRHHQVTILSGLRAGERVIVEGAEKSSNEWN